MTISVHTNQSALVALQNLNKTNDQLEQTQNRVSTGLNVATAKDNASVWAIAQGQRSDINALAAVTSSLNRATSIADVAQTAGESISDLLSQVKEKVLAASDTSIDATSREALNSDFQSLLKQIGQVVQNATFDGSNILNGSVTSIGFLANVDATSTITLSGRNMSVGAGIITIPATASILTSTAANSLLSVVDTSLKNVNLQLGQMGSQAKQIDAHTTFVSKLSDTLQSGVGNLVDADLSKESARLTALQVQQQLGVQALSIANQAPQTILSLFK